MTHQHLFTAFSSSLNWNAMLYIFYKVTSTIMSLYLFHRLTIQDFSTWANTQSIIFLLLLWFDFGLRKSIPRFAPLFSTHHSFRSFTTTLFLFQLCILFIIAPCTLYIGSLILFYFFPTSYSYFSLYCSGVFYAPIFIYLAAGLFISEGLIAIVRSLFHAQFKNKLFNLSSTATLILELSLNTSILCFYTSSHSIVIGILISKIFCGMLLIAISLFFLNRPLHNELHPSEKHHHNINKQSSPTAGLLTAGVKHSLIMWIYTNLKSLSERNFLLPMLTYTLGAGAANLFKVALDGALIFERTVIKTIGSSDTALLAHIEMSDDKEVRDNAFQKLIRKIAALCIPLFGILLFIFVQGYMLTTNNVAFQIFLIVTGTYLLEVLLSPYERMLEVKQEYLLLLYAYIPYICVIFYLFSQVSLIGLLHFIVIMQGVRLVSSILMVGIARYYYGAHFPWAFTSTLLCVVCSSSFICVYLINTLVTSAVAASAATTALNYFGMH